MKLIGGKEAGLTALRRSMEILRILVREQGGCAFSKLRMAEDNLSAASLSRLLKAMACEGLVAKDTISGRYHLGEGFRDLAREAIVATAAPARERLRPVVEGLARESGESAVFFECEGDGAMLGVKSELPERFHYIEPFQRMGSFLSHGFGLVITAWTSEPLRTALLKANSPVPLPLKDYQQLLARIHGGVLVVPDLTDNGRNVRVAAPVFAGEGGPLLGAIGVSFWEQRYTPERMAAIENAVRQAASLGGRLLQG